MAGKFVLSTTANGQYMFNLKAGNGETILTSESYQSKDGALNGIDSVRKNAALDERYERRTASNGAFYFVLKAANHQEIGRSEMYSSQAAMENGIASVKRNAPEAPLDDQTAS
ncbi:YegP family protein [Meiothermus sp.]|jgi:uncharacterized protein YegP (UPF0339 family)|uniref:YegP family protein n=1 Tax=Meiothermus sp. TaxID=1955249 RepID=UPI0021DD1594|nr:YegP family protein [Meiothermus sp.]GIW24721.1 MAG: UPF0339 protein YegP [Meiothermus sp.]